MAVADHKTIKVGLIIILCICFLAFLVTLFMIPRFSQPQSYHEFADAKGSYGIPNFANVVTNFPLFLVGVLGVWQVWKLTSEGDKDSSPIRNRFLLYSIFVWTAITGIGSAYYHFDPNNEDLLWDRLPMTILFVSFVAFTLAERANERIGLWSYGPLIVLALASNLYWIYTEREGAGDLRFYVLMQVLCVCVVILSIALFPVTGYTANHYWYWIVGFFVAARASELADHPIFDLTRGVVGGHPLKHLLASLSILCLIFYIREKRLIPLQKHDGITKQIGGNVVE